MDYNDFSSSTTIIISTVLLAAVGWIPRFFRQTRNFFMVLYPLLLTKMWIAPKNVQACVTALLYTWTTLFSLMPHCFKVKSKCGKLSRIMKLSICRILETNLSRVDLPSFWTIHDNQWCASSTSASSSSAGVTQVFSDHIAALHWAEFFCTGLYFRIVES